MLFIILAATHCTKVSDSKDDYHNCRVHHYTDIGASRCEYFSS